MELLVGLESRLLDPEVRRSPEQVAGSLMDSFVEIGSSGRVYTTAQMVAEPAEETPRRVEATDFCSTEVAPGVALLTYRTTAAGVEALQSSFWVEQAGGWKLMFHQGAQTRMPSSRTDPTEECVATG